MYLTVSLFGKDFLTSKDDAKIMYHQKLYYLIFIYSVQSTLQQKIHC